MTLHVLVLCTRNSARSVLAEAMLNHHAVRLGLVVRAHSAGIATTGLRSKSWDEFSRDGAPPLSLVITVCDSAAAEVCPVFFGGPGGTPAKVHWGYPDPSNAEGGDDGKRRAFQLTRQALGYRLLQLLALPLATLDRAALQAAAQTIGRS